ncbi:hypothetical protein E2E30_03090 [Sphingomonas sp. AAP5]|uniref:hypothetical protein n=1 Tax=Sphingomonas sp. AAP5 TaxID=1523415 RepID=UPI001056E371|nr:hypothetical protein [Sphingomonas sp. AAP5]QBM74853.1 hypothetical protein E2E30_03090 [Sphingomonas sp. AAP5]
MSSESDFKAQLIASVMVKLHGIQQNAKDLVEALYLEALGGSRKAKDTLANPWNSSVPPSRRKQEIETQLDYVRGILEKHGPIFFAAALEEMRLEKQREYQRDREKGAGPIDVKDGLALLDPGYARIINILRDQARVSNRDAERASVETIIQAGRVIKRQTEDRWCDHVVSVRELSQARVLQHVSVPVGWSLATGKVWYTERAGDYWHHDPVTNTLRAEPAPDPYFDSERCQTILPTPLNIDPPGLPRAWTPDSAAEMHSVLWDALPDEPFYRSFIRKIEDDESIALYSECALPDDEEPTPPFASVEAMIRFDDEFRAAYKRADRRFRVLNGYHADLDGMTFEELFRSDRKRDQELLEWAFPVGGKVLSNTALWDAWKPWGILLASLKDYLDIQEVGERGCLVFAWAYFLKGRLAQTEDELPVFIREAMFDWMLLPVPSVLTPAVRVLVPRDKLLLQPVPHQQESQKT